MKINRMIRKPIILVVLLSTLLVATLPQEVVFAEDVVRLTVTTKP